MYVGIDKYLISDLAALARERGALLDEILTKRLVELQEERATEREERKEEEVASGRR